MVVGLLTGHCRLNKHMHNSRLGDDDLCRFCLEEEETAVHVLSSVRGWRGCYKESWGNPTPCRAASWRNRYLG
ncbi:hypothetical protein O3M35_004731 [Rhynocoris fuscipes]|uniref:Uncharacterized protein n=1 Tax=Rhynocoris fuscipes TaxID=488301 RepID=A0AAW1DH32_9HEMI